MTIRTCDDDNVCREVELHIVVDESSALLQADNGGLGNDALDGLLGLIIAPVLWFLQEPLRHCFDKRIYGNKTDTQAATTVASTASGVPKSIVAGPASASRSLGGSTLARAVLQAPQPSSSSLRAQPNSRDGNSGTNGSNDFSSGNDDSWSSEGSSNDFSDVGDTDSLSRDEHDSK